LASIATHLCETVEFSKDAELKSHLTEGMDYRNGNILFSCESIGGQYPWIVAGRKSSGDAK
jgi:hypothetical protein